MIIARRAYIGVYRGLGYFDDEVGRLEPSANRFGPKV
jgi:hypothetical protein